MKTRHQKTIRAEGRHSRRRNGLELRHPLLAGLLLLAALTPSRAPAQTNTANLGPSPQRWLLIVETSRPMQRRADAVLGAVQELLNSNMAGQAQPGDTLGVWTFNAELYAGRSPLRTWSPEAQQDIASRTLTFLKAQKYEKQANFDKVLPALSQVVKDSRLLTIVLVSSGDQKMRGTPFDDQLNEFYQKWHDEQQKARMPFVIAMRAKAGQLADYAFNTPPFPTQMPRLLPARQIAEPIQEKLIEALHNPPPPAVPPLILSGKKSRPEKALAPKPEPAIVKVAAAAAAPSTNDLVVAKPPAPAVPPVQTAKVEVAPVPAAKPPPQVAPKPAPAPVPAIEPKADVVKAPDAKPVVPAPPKPDAAPVVQTPPPKPTPVVIEPPKSAPAPEPKLILAPAPVLALPATQAVAVSAPAPRPPPSVPPPSAKPAPPAQTATAVPAEALARHSSIWIASLILAGVAAIVAVLLVRRSRAAPQASLITQSFERKNKP